MLQKGHQPVQDLNELVDVRAGLFYKIHTLYYSHLIETGAMVAKEHKSVVEGLVVPQLTKRSTRNLSISRPFLALVQRYRKWFDPVFGGMPEWI